MIVISGALVLVALVLLIIGLIAKGLTAVYLSIGVSVVAFIFLLIGILQRRGEQVPETASDTSPATPEPVTAGSDVEGVTAILPPAARAESAPTEATAASGSGGSGTAVSGKVLVVPGRPRYHVEGCRYLTGKDPEEVDVSTARSDGYSSCGVCKPDDALAQAAESEALPPAAAIVAAEEAASPEPVTAAKRTTRAPATTSSGRTPAKKAATKAPAKAAAKKAPAKTAAASGAAAGKVVVIPDRGKFHKADCRFVQSASDTKEMTRAAAGREGYVACGVCKP